MISFSNHIFCFLNTNIMLFWMIIRPAPYSFYTFSRMAEVKEIIVVCDPSYRDVFEGFIPCNMHLLLWHVLCIGCIVVGHIILIWFCSCSQTPSIRSRLNLNSPFLGRKDKILFTVDSRCMHICILFSTTLRMKMSPWSWRKSLRFVFLGNVSQLLSSIESTYFIH